MPYQQEQENAVSPDLRPVDCSLLAEHEPHLVYFLFAGNENAHGLGRHGGVFKFVRHRRRYDRQAA